MKIEEILGKTNNGAEPGCSVIDHLRWVGSIADAYYERCLPQIRGRLSRELLVGLALLHDIGKVSPGFQRKIWRNVEDRFKPDWAQELCKEANAFLDDEKGVQTRHDFIGYYLMNKKIKKWSKVIQKHHGREYVQTETDFDFGGQDWIRLRREIIDTLFSEFDISFEDFPKKPTETQLDLATGYLVVCDWIGSDERFNDVFERRNFKERANEVLDKLGFIRAEYKRNQSFEDLFGFKPNAIQQRFGEICSKPGVFVVESSTGSGKTEAALWGAYRLLERENAGLYFALPTRVTSNKIHERITPFIEKVFGEGTSVRLTHGLSWLERNDDEEDSWFNASKRGLLQEFGVGTVDQSLLGVLNVKHNVLRLFGLAGKVVIVDEAHTYDEYTGGVLDALIRRLEAMGTTVIILSATLTAARRARLLGAETVEQFESYPLISYRYYSGEEGRAEVGAERSRVVEICHIKKQDDCLQEASLALESAERGGLVLCVKNTIDEAQRLYRQILTMNRRVDSNRIGVLHSRFSSRRRGEIEETFLSMFGKCGDRSSGAILVSTQIVEQSVDIDADLLITEIAPSDMLIQRIGRLWRHQRENRPEPAARAYIVSPEADVENFVEDLDKTSFIYQPYILWRTLEEIQERDKLTIPSDIRGLLETTYSEREETNETLLEMKGAADKEREKLARIAENSTGNRLPQADEKTISRTRYDNEPSMNVVIVKNVLQNPTRIVTASGAVVKANGFYNRKDAREIQRDVIVRRKNKNDKNWENELDDVSKRIFHAYFSKHIGADGFVCLRAHANTPELETLNGEPTEYFYTDKLGLYTTKSEPEPILEEEDGDFDLEKMPW